MMCDTCHKYMYIKYIRQLTSNMDNKFTKRVCKDVSHCSHNELNVISGKKIDI